MAAVSRRLVLRTRHALGTWPDARGWRDTMLLAAGYAAVAVPIALASDLFSVGWTSSSAVEILIFALVALVAPGLSEEWLFRVLLIPHRTEAVSSRRRWIWAGISLMLFIVWHPLNANLLYSQQGDLFYEPIFLTLAGLLGLACTLAYLRTGSVWPAVVIHWLAVVIWKLTLGGKMLQMPAVMVSAGPG